MEVDLAQSRNDLLSAEGGAARAADRFKLAVGLPMDAPIRVVAETAPRFYEVDPDLALQHALAHRAEIRNTEADVRRAEITVAETDARSAIKGELRAYYDLTGIGSSEDDLPLRDMWDLSWQRPRAPSRQQGRGLHPLGADLGQRRQRRRGGGRARRAGAQRDRHRPAAPRGHPAGERGADDPEREPRPPRAPSRAAWRWPPAASTSACSASTTATSPARTWRSTAAA